MEHSFNVDIAIKYGLEQAVFIHNLYFWIKKNVANKTNLFDGRYWTYNSAKAYSELFPYMSESKIYRVIKNLVDEGFILKGNYNENKYIQTAWYAFSDDAICVLKNCGYDISNMVNCILQNEENHFAELKNGSLKSEKCITDNKPNNNTDNKPYIIYGENEFSQPNPSKNKFSKSLGLTKENLNVKQSTIDKIDKAFEQLVFPIEDDEIKRLFFVLCCSPKWRNKTIHALQMSLNKVQHYERDFVLRLIEDSIAGGWQGLVFENTDAKYQDYLKSKRNIRSGLIRTSLIQLSEEEKRSAIEHLKMIEEDEQY